MEHTIVHTSLIQQVILCIQFSSHVPDRLQKFLHWLILFSIISHILSFWCLKCTPTIDKFPFLQPLWSWKKSKNICVKSHGISDFHFFIFEKGDKHHFIIVWKNTVGPKFFLTSQKAFMTKGNSPMFGLIKKIVHFTA